MGEFRDYRDRALEEMSDEERAEYDAFVAWLLETRTDTDTDDNPHT